MDAADFEPLAPGCMKCEAVTGKATCFPNACAFWCQSGSPGTKSHSIATLDRIRRGMRETVSSSLEKDPK